MDVAHYIAAFLLNLALLSAVAATGYVQGWHAGMRRARRAVHDAAPPSFIRDHLR